MSQLQSTMANTNQSPRVSEVSFRFDVPKITTLDEALSPDFIIYGVPWNVSIKLINRGTEKWLAIFLNCATKDKSPNWSYVSSASFKILPFDHLGVTEGHIRPYVFNNTNQSSCSWMIRWCDVLDNTKHYVKNDIISFKVKIHVVDPNEVNKSELIFENINRSCEEGCLTKYRLTINNIGNLKAVRSPMFMLRNTQWYLSVYKDHLGKLNIGLAPKNITKESSCEIKISVKISSTVGGVKAKECMRTWKFDGNYCNIAPLALLDELTKPENGFMQNNSITIELQLNLDNLKDEVRTNGQKCEITATSTNSKLLKLECAICLGGFGDQEVSFTPCGHMFCSKCIEDSVKLRKRCPSCNGPVELVELKRAHLPW